MRLLWKKIASIRIIGRAQFSVRWKIVLMTLGLVTLAFALVGVAVLQATGDLLVKQRVAEEFSRVEELAVQMSAPLRDYDADALYKLAADSEIAANARVLVLSPTGVVLVDGGSELCGIKLNHIEVERVIAGRERANGFHNLAIADSSNWAKLVGQGSQWVGYYVTPILVGGNRAGMVLMSSSVQDVVERLAGIRASILLYFVVGAVAAALMGVAMSGFVTKPINALTRVMLKTTSGDFSARAETHGRDEIAQLGSTFNMMSEKLESLDKARSDFISSASHELKTPLSGMKILVESLYHAQNMDDETRKEFLGDIDKEIDRLTAIIGDLLTLVRIDSYGLAAMPTEFLLSKVIEETVERMRLIADTRSIQIEAEVADDPEMLTDRGKLTQVLYNLIDNAVKYTPDGGQVTVNAHLSGKQVVISIKDTGVGIPDDSLSQIFERFYRVDKARSRSTGGTGLGLSIVRNLVELLEGDIGVESTPGQGSVFTVTLPCRLGD